MRFSQEELELQVLRHLTMSQKAIAKARAMGMTVDHINWAEEGAKFSYHRQLCKLIFNYFDESGGSLLTANTLESKMVEGNVADVHRGKLAVLWTEVEAEECDENDTHNLIASVIRRKALGDFHDTITEVPAKLADEDGLEAALDFISERMENIREQLTMESSEQQIVSVKEDADYLAREYKKRLANPRGIFTGIKQIDDVTFGTQPGELWCWIAPTGGGKSLHMLNAAVAANAMGANVLWFSFEMPTYECYLRHVSLTQRVTFKSLIGCQIEEHEFGNLIEQIKGHEGEPYFIYDGTMRDPTPEYVEAKILEFERENRRPDLVVVDYIGKMTTRDMRRDAKKYECEEAAFNKLHSVANRLLLSVWTAQQINRNALQERKKAREGGKGYMFDPSSVSGGQVIMHLASYVIATDPYREENRAVYECVKNRRLFFERFAVQVQPEFNMVTPLEEQENNDFLASQGLSVTSSSDTYAERTTPKESRPEPGKIRVSTMGDEQNINEEDLEIDTSGWNLE